MAKTAEKPKAKKDEPTRERVMVVTASGKTKFEWREVSK
jgi:hypothetical protein